MEKANLYFSSFLKYFLFVISNHFGHAWKHPLEMIEQIYNFYGSLTKCKKNKFIAQPVLEMKMTHHKT